MASLANVRRLTFTTCWEASSLHLFLSNITKLRLLPCKPPVGKRRGKRYGMCRAICACVQGAERFFVYGCTTLQATVTAPNTHSTNGSPKAAASPHERRKRVFFSGFGGKSKFVGDRMQKSLPPSLPPSLDLFFFFLCCSFAVWKLEIRGHKSHRYWCGYEPQPNGDDSARSFSSASPTPEMGFGHSSFNLPLSSAPFSFLH